MKHLYCSVLLFLYASVFYSCKSAEPVVIIQDPLVLQDIAPLPKTIVPKKVVEYEPVYNIFKIIEVAEVNGVQKTFIARIGNDRTGIASGVTGDISEDQEFSKQIGTFKITEVTKDFFNAQIEMLSYKIGKNGYVRIKIGEKVRESKESN